jgi:hypothetical protein
MVTSRICALCSASDSRQVWGQAFQFTQTMPYSLLATYV